MIYFKDDAVQGLSTTEVTNAINKAFFEPLEEYIDGPSP